MNPTLILVFLMLVDPLDLGRPAAELVIDSQFHASRKLMLSEEPLHCFGGRPLELRLRTGGIGGKLEAQLYQLSTALAVPVGEPIVLKPHGSVSAIPVYRHVHSIPRVDHQARFELRFYVYDEVQGHRRPVGVLPIVVYPNEVLQPLRLLSKQVPLLVADEVGVLRHFLREQQIEFGEPPERREAEPQRNDAAVGTDSGARRTLQGGLVLLAPKPCEEGSAERAEIEASIAKWRKAGLDVVVLWESSEGLPRLIVSQAELGSRVDVKMTLIEGLAGRPQAQSALVEAIQMVRAQVAPIP